jgi:hypothetical protein
MAIFIFRKARLALTSEIQASDNRRLFIGGKAIVQLYFVTVSLVLHFLSLSSHAQT